MPKFDYEHAKEEIARDKRYSLKRVLNAEDISASNFFLG